MGHSSLLRGVTQFWVSQQCHRDHGAQAPRSLLTYLCGQGTPAVLRRPVEPSMRLPAARKNPNLCCKAQVRFLCKKQKCAFQRKLGPLLAAWRQTCRGAAGLPSTSATHPSPTTQVCWQIIGCLWHLSCCGAIQILSPAPTVPKSK